MLWRGGGRSQRHWVVQGRCGTSPHGKPMLSPHGEGGQIQGGPTAPFPFPSLPLGACAGPAGQGPRAGETEGAGQGVLVTVGTPHPGQLQPLSGTWGRCLGVPWEQPAAAGWKFRLRA